MDLKKLNPWNWFKHEEKDSEQSQHVPVTLDAATGTTPGLSSPPSLFNLHREMDRIFDDVFNALGLPSRRSDYPASGDWSAAATTYRPSIDVSGSNDHYEIALDVPGLSEQDLSIEVRNDVLTISGQKEVKTENKDKHYYRVERHLGAFQRTLSLPADANTDDIRASLKSGVLRLKIPRLASVNEEEVRKISIDK